MRQFPILRRLVPAAMILMMAILVTSCASTNKYGCPNNIQASDR